MSNEHDIVLERLQVKDALLFGLADTLDMKASVSLVVITFLATQTGGFLLVVDSLDWVRTLQTIVACSLAFAGICAILALWPRDFFIETAEELDSWMVQLNEYYRDMPDAASKVEAALAHGRIKRAKQRIKTNSETDARKGSLVNWAYRLAGIALMFNIITLICLWSPL